MQTVKRLAGTLVPAAVMICVMTFFSLYTVLMKRAMHDGSNPLVLALLRECIAVAALMPFAYFMERRKPKEQRNFWPRPEDYGTFFLLGALMIWCVQLLSALSLKHISAGSYALMAPSVPVFTLIVAMIAGYEKFNRASRASWLKMAAIVVTVGGAVYIAVSGFMQHATGTGAGSAMGSNPLVGFLFLFCNKLAIGAYPNLERFLFKKYPTHVVVSWGYATGSILTFMSTVTCADSAADWHVSPTGWGAILYSALISSALNYQLMAWVNRRTSPLLVMTFYPWQAVATPVLAYVMLGAAFAPHDAVGGLLICAGLGCLMYARYLEGVYQAKVDAAAATAATSTDASAGKTEGLHGNDDSGSGSGSGSSHTSSAAYTYGGSGMMDAELQPSLSIQLPIHIPFFGGGGAHHKMAEEDTAQPQPQPQPQQQEEAEAQAQAQEVVAEVALDFQAGAEGAAHSASSRSSVRHS